jgi:N-acetylglucosaminylphosphatidylinositol deacetylase
MPLVPRALADADAAYVLVTAHPDDEAMFFSPTLFTLTRQVAAADRTYLLCLSTGDAGGLGATRVRELRAAARVLGLRDEHVAVTDDTALRDGMRTEWPTATVRAHVEAFVAQRIAPSRRVVLVTFDEGGVSRHPNHVATGAGVRTVERANTHVLLLETTSRVRKYAGMLDHVASAMTHGGEVVVTPVPRGARTAMACHASQLVWYRRVFIRLSRYAYINTFTEHQR